MSYPTTPPHPLWVSKFHAETGYSTTPQIDQAFYNAWRVYKSEQLSVLQRLAVRFADNEEAVRLIQQEIRRVK